MVLVSHPCTASVCRCHDVRPTSPSSLNANKTAYVGGKAFCSREEQLLSVLLQCEGNASGSVLFPSGNGIACYRIPVLVTDGPTMLAFAEARVYSCSDHGPKHLAMRRSSDSGRSWDPITFIFSDPLHDASYDGMNLGCGGRGAPLVLFAVA